MIFFVFAHGFCRTGRNEIFIFEPEHQLDERTLSRRRLGIQVGQRDCWWFCIGVAWRRFHCRRTGDFLSFLLLLFLLCDRLFALVACNINEISSIHFGNLHFQGTFGTQNR